MKLIKSKKYKEGIKITSFFIISNVALIVYYDSLTKLKSYSLTSPTIWINAFTWFIFCALQNVAHWMFSYEYYNMVRVISYIMDDIPVP